MNREEKIQRAKEFLGSKYLLHPSQRIKRIPTSIPSYTQYKANGHHRRFKSKPIS